MEPGCQLKPSHYPRWMNHFHYIHLQTSCIGIELQYKRHVGTLQLQNEGT